MVDLNLIGLVGNYGGVCDALFITFVPELIEAYPDAVVVLVERDIEAWYKSFDTAITGNLFNPFLQAIANPEVGFLNQIGRMMKPAAGGCFGAETRKHYSSTRQPTPPKHLLAFDLRDGWEPLCKIPGLPIADCPLPRVNDGEAMQVRIKVVFRRMLGVLVRQVMMVAREAVVVVFVGMCWYSKVAEVCL